MASRSLTVRFLEAVAARDYSAVQAFSTRKGFKPNALAHVESIGWSAPDKPAGAMVIAADNADTKMIKLLRSLGTHGEVNAAGDDPLFIIAQATQFASYPALKALIDRAPVPSAARLYDAFNATLMHCTPAQTATKKLAVFCLMNRAVGMSDAQARQISHLALQRYAGQSEFEPAIRLLAGNWRMHYEDEQPLAIKLALTNYPAKPETLGLVRQHGLKQA
jgi:hypothetical protein